MLTASIVLYHHSPTEVSDIINCVLKSSVSTLFIVDNSTNDVSRKLENVSDRIWYIHSAKLLQKSEMRKDIVIELSYKGFG